MNYFTRGAIIGHILTAIFSAGLVSIGVATGAVKCESKAEVETIVRSLLPKLVIEKDGIK
jgi:hypothetical protein